MLDLIIKNGIVLTMAGKGVGLITDGAVGIKGKDIAVVDHTTLVMKEYQAERVIDAAGKIILPGLIDVHCHSYYGAISKGILTDLEYFLEQGTAGYEDTLDLDTMIASTKGHLLEGIRRGTTTFGDMGKDMDKICAVHQEFGVRARICESMRELPWDIRDMLETGEYIFDRKYAEPNIANTYRLLDQLGTDPAERLSALVCFQGIDYCSEELMIEMRELAKKRNTLLHTHVAQSPFEMEQAKKRFGGSPVDVLEKLGLLNENTIGAHMVYSSPEDNKKAASAGVKLAACPFSWMEVGVTPPTAQYLYHGGICGIGCDEASYTSVNAFAEMKACYLNNNVDAYHHNVPMQPMAQFLRMHTIDSAKVLGIDQVTGSLEPGKRADLIIMDPKRINMTPLLIDPLINIPQLLVAYATGEEVETVICDGQILMEDRVMKTIDEQAVMDELQAAGERAAKAAAEYYGQLEESEVLERQKWFCS